MQIALVDIGISNTGSVTEAFKRIGAPVSLTSDPAAIAKADAIVLPGVGAFADGMASLRGKGVIAALQGAVKAGRPILGFCLGLQLMASESEEHGRHEGLKLFGAKVRKLKPANGERVPNIGWCDVSPKPGSILFHGIPAGTALYFAHSYWVECENGRDVGATLGFGEGAVTAAVETGNVFGLQAHPEKSQDAGLTVLSNFVEHVRS